MNIKEIFRDTSKKMMGCLIFGCMATFISMGFLQAQVPVDSGKFPVCQNPPERVGEYINYLSSIKVTNNDNKDNIEELLQDYFIYYKSKVENLKKPLALRGRQPGQVGFNREDINTPATHGESIHNELAYESLLTDIKCKFEKDDDNYYTYNDLYLSISSYNNTMSQQKRERIKQANILNNLLLERKVKIEPEWVEGLTDELKNNERLNHNICKVKKQSECNSLLIDIARIDNNINRENNYKLEAVRRINSLCDSRTED